MLKIDRILCPTDMPSESDEALRYALALAQAYKAKLILLYCRKPGSLVDWSNSANAARLFQQALFTHVDADELTALEWEPVISEAEDDVGKTIIEQASKRGADLIVMRSRRRPHAAALFGSTAETVSRYAPCPVLVVHDGERECVGFTTGEIDLKRILVTHDFSPGSELALNYGLLLAQENRAELHLLHVLDQEEDPPEFALAHVNIESLCNDAAVHLQDAIPKEALHWCGAVTAVRWGDVAPEILTYVENHKIDLICIGARGAGFDLHELFGSTTEHVLRRANCPVLVARPAVLKAASAKAA